MLNLFNLLSNHFRQRLYDLSNYMQPERDLDRSYERPVAQTTPSFRGDSWEPSKQALSWKPPVNSTAVQPEVESALAEPRTTGTSDPTDTKEPAPSSPAEPTYSYLSRSRLDYRMNLRFDLSTIVQTASELNEGESASLTSLAAGGFGLSTDLRFKGSQVIERVANGDLQESDRTSLRQKGMSRSSSVSQFAMQDKNFGLQAFHREAGQIKRTLRLNNVEGHSTAVRKFALRFRSDSSFQFASLQRFNVQTQQVSEGEPSRLGEYLEAAGGMAEKGTNEMMAAFFDAVDTHLEGAEDRLIAQANAAFDLAASELGFSQELVDFARDNMVGTIEGFFNRVEAAVEALESRFVTSVESPAVPSGLPLAIA